MAAATVFRLLRRRIAGVLPQASTPNSPGFSFPSAVTAASVRSLQTKIEDSNVPDEHPGDVDARDSDSKTALSPTEESNLRVRGFSSLKTSPRHDLAMIFTCRVCETRSVKMASRESYEKGVVIARCGGCNNLHLIADRLGWFGKPGSIEDLLAARGEEVKKGSTDTLNLTLEDLAGSKST